LEKIKRNDMFKILKETENEKPRKKIIIGGLKKKKKKQQQQ